MTAAIKPETHSRPDIWPGLPPRKMAVLYLLVCLFPLSLATLSHTTPLDRWEAFGAALGLTALVAMLVQILSSGRFRRISGGMGVDRIMAFHKIAAYWVLLAVLLHPLAYVLPTFLDDPARGMERLIAYHVMPQFLTGVIAMAALLMLVVSSVMRAWLQYELWRGTHVVLTLIALGFGLHHALTVGRLSAIGPLHGLIWGIGAAAFVAMAVLYGWRWLLIHRQTWRLDKTVKLADRIWELEIVPAAGVAPLDYKAGQFVWMTEGARRFPLWDHPFSIASSPQEDRLRLIIKEVGDFTRKVVRLPAGTPIGIDGPYGTFTLERHPGQTILLIAGGVGIAPIMGLLRDLAARGDPRPIRVAYAVGQADNLACLPELEATKAQLDLRVMLISETAPKDWRGETGFLDHGKLSALLEGCDPSQTVAMICGPGPMVTAVADTLLDIGLPMDNVVYERFDYAGGLSARQDRRRTFGMVSLLLVLMLVVAGLSQILLL